MLFKKVKNAYSHMKWDQKKNQITKNEIRKPTDEGNSVIFVI